MPPTFKKIVYLHKDKQKYKLNIEFCQIESIALQVLEQICIPSLETLMDKNHKSIFRGLNSTYCKRKPSLYLVCLAELLSYFLMK